jgi:outer membrane lipoprotein SlyB
VNATSELLRDVKDPRETTTGSILTDAGIGAAGGAAVGGILGRVSVGSVLGGAAAGAIIGNVTAQRVVVIEPNQTLTLTTQ